MLSIPLLLLLLLLIHIRHYPADEQMNWGGICRTLARICLTDQRSDLMLIAMMFPSLSIRERARPGRREENLWQVNRKLIDAYLGTYATITRNA